MLNIIVTIIYKVLGRLPIVLAAVWITALIGEVPNIDAVLALGI